MLISPYTAREAISQAEVLLFLNQTKQSLSVTNLSKMAQSPSKDGTSAKRPIRIANCSGANADPGIHMLRQAKYGDCDVITGDYLAEFNLARHAEQFEKGAHPGWEPTALEGLTLSLEISNEKRIKVIINGGALNPKGLAEKTLELV